MASDMTSASPQELADRLSHEHALWVRMALCRQQHSDPFQLRLLEITAGKQPPQWAPQRWAYPDVIFTAKVVPGEVAAGWLRSNQISIDDDSAMHDEFPARLNWERRDSWADGQYETLVWPCWEVSLLNLTNAEPSRPLVSDDDDTPSFATFLNAAAAFFQLGSRPTGGSAPTSAVLRWQDSAVRIRRVHIAPDEITVDVEGDHLDDLTVELAGDDPGQRQRTWTRSGSPSTDSLTFPLTDGVPAGAWVIARRGSEWLDRRFLTWPWARAQQQGVEVEVPAQTRIDGFIANREGPNVEFKRQVPDDEDSKARVMKTVCAFANGNGGSILFGIDDDYNVVGVPSAKAGALIDQVTQLIDSWVEPVPPHTFEVLAVEASAAVVIELIVSAGPRLYGSSKPNEPRRVYVRHYARSVPARIGEIEEIAQARGTSSSWGLHT